MNINYKAYRIWRVLLDSPNQWLSVMDVAHDVNMTARQVSSIVGTMPSPPVVKERDGSDKNIYIMVQGTDDEIFRLKSEVVSSYFDISQDMCHKVQCALSPVGWMSVADISDDTGVERLNVSRILSIMPNVVCKGTGSITLYRLKGWS